MSRRTALFIPGNNPGMLTTGDVLGADVLILDLEDAVALSEKDAARILVREALHSVPFTHVETAVRINPLDSPYWQEDLAEIVPAQPDALVIPKASVEAVQQMEKVIEQIEKEKGAEKKVRFLLLIESARSLLDLPRIAASSERNAALLLGAEDYSADMGIERTPFGKEIEYARFTLATTARAYGLDAIDTPYTDMEDRAGLAKDTRFAKSIGFTGRLCIHPAHIDPVTKVFNPTKEAIEEAIALLEAAEKARQEGIGVFSYKGKMVDLPVIHRAKSVLDTAKSGGLL